MGSVDALIGRAWRRWVSNLLLNQVVLAGCVAMCGLILVLLAGTDLLDWFWILPIATAGVAAGAWRLKRQLPHRYAVAQAVDRRLKLQDSLSTAYFHAHLSRRQVSERIVAAQLAEAEALAAQARLERAMPFAAPRSLYAMAALGLAASGLLTVRYGAARRLDLKAPLPKLVLDIFHFTAKAQPVAKKQERDKRAEDLMKQFGLSLGDDAQKGQPGREDQVPGTASEEGERTELSKEKAAQSGKAGAEGDPEQQGESEAAGLSIPQEGDQGRHTSNDQPGASAQASNNPQNPSGPQQNNSLLDKFRDALANLMSRLKSHPRDGEGQQSASAQDRSGEGQGKQGEHGQQSAGNNSKGMPGGQGQGEQEGQGAEQAAEAGQGSQSTGDSERASQEGRSGIGKDDGSKDVKQAEQLAAMGKISEILGKRAQTLTGEVMVEVTTSKQQLRTPYSQQSATHAEAGGEIHRDEVPLAYQRYVRQYFEEIRKTAPPPKEPAATSARP